MIHDRCQCGKIACVGQTVQTDDPVIRIFVQHMKNKIASDKAGTAGNDNSHNPNSFYSFNAMCPDIFRPAHLSSTAHIDFFQYFIDF